MYVCGPIILYFTMYLLFIEWIPQAKLSMSIVIGDEEDCKNLEEQNGHNLACVARHYKMRKRIFQSYFRKKISAIYYS